MPIPSARRLAGWPGGGGLLDRDERRADRHRVSGLGMQAGDGAGEGRRNVHQRLGGLDLAERLVEVHGVAHLDEPLHELRLFEALA